MSSGPSTTEAAKETWMAINRGLPNIPTFIRVVLKREKLSEEAESYRQRYEHLLAQLEQQSGVTLRPASLIGDDDSGYFSANRPKGVTPSGDVTGALPFVINAGFLLRRDDKLRWHRCWCKVDLKDMRFSIFEDSNEEALVRSFSLENSSSYFSPTVAPKLQECDKENCFIVTGIVATGNGSADSPSGAGEPVENGAGGGGSIDEICFAAYTDAELQKWKEVLQLVATSRESGRMSFPYIDSSTSTSSSNFSSNRDSMISTASSMLYAFRNPSRAESPPRGKSLERDSQMAEDIKALSLAKQQQPLPQPPAALDANEDGGNASDGTIYESIENLVLQFDATMKGAAEALGQFGQNMKGGGAGGKKRKKKGLVRQHSLFSSKGKKSKALSQKKAELERGQRFSGYMHKRSSNGSWKKKWCVLKGCVFGYYKSPDDNSDGREWVVLSADIHIVKDSKRPFVFSLACKGASEMCFSVDSDEQYMEWLSKLESASKDDRRTELEQDLWQDEGLDETNPPQFSEGIYNVPRPATGDNSTYDIPRNYPFTPPPTHMSSEAAIDSGLYSVPRVLLMEDPVPHTILAAHGQQFHIGGNPFDTYAVPRPISMSPDEDEEGIYDNPFDVVEDMEIYDYPPDVSDLSIFGLDSSGMDLSGSNRHSVITLDSEFASSFVSDRASSLFSEDSWKTVTLPPVPSSTRPSTALSTTSSDEYYQSSRNSLTSMEGLYDYPRSGAVDSFLSSVVERPHDPTTDVDIPDSALEYGQCTMRGVLLKRERMSKWNKTFCIIRNNFLECHKLHGNAQHVPPGAIPNLKLFLPRSEVTKEPNSKKPWTFQVKHPRREGALLFAAETEEEFRRWMRAFRSAASIEVQAVANMEEIRITDLELKQKWKDYSGPQQNGGINHGVESTSSEDVRDRKGSWSRRSTVSVSGSSEGGEYQSDTLKRRKKFSWMKANFMKRKSADKRSATISSTDLSSYRFSNMSFDVPESPMYDPMRRSVSLELLSAAEGEQKGSVGASGAVSSQDISQAHRSTTPEGLERFQGYLRVQRRGADSMWVRYWCIFEELALSCFISQRDLTLTLSIHLRGSRIAEALMECKREHTFKVWHLESGQCLFFAADSRVEYQMWFKEITRGAEYIVAADDVAVPLPTPYYFFPKESSSSTPVGGEPSPSQGSSRSSCMSLPEEGDNISEGSSTTGPPTATQQEAISHQGDLKKLSHSGKWKDRQCVIKGCTLTIYHTSSDSSPLASASLQACNIELLSLPAEDPQLFPFRIIPMVGKVLTFATPSQQERDTWLTVFRDCSHVKPTDEMQRQALSGSLRQRRKSDTNAPGSANQSPATSRRNSRSSQRKQSKSKSKDTELVSYVPASKLTNPVCSGMAEVQVESGPWTRFWCVIDSNCLYVYGSQESSSTTRTVVLPGYSVQKAGPEITRPFAVQLAHPGVPTVFFAVGNPTDLEQWFQALEQGSKAEGSTQNTAVEGGQQEMPETGKGARAANQKPHSRSSMSKKGPVKGDHSLLKDTSAMLPPSGRSKAPANDYQSQRRAIIHRYEKKLKKTQRVANQTEQSLKHQQAALAHVKQELSRHTTKLKALSDKGDQHAKKKLSELLVKLHQVDKILPYLTKYITVNRQADAQTEAILRESCNMELQKLQSGGNGAMEHAVQGSCKKATRSSRSSSRPTSTGASSIRSSSGPPGPTITEEEVDTPETTIPTVPEQTEPPLEVTSNSEHHPQRASVEADRLTEGEPDRSGTSTQPASVETGGEPDRSDTSSTITPPTAEADTPSELPQKEQVASNYGDDENPYASLTDIKSRRKSPQSEGVGSSGPHSDYAELDFTRFTKPSQLRPPSVNYAEVTFDPNTGRPVLTNSPKKSTEGDTVVTASPTKQFETNELTDCGHTLKEGNESTQRSVNSTGEVGVSTMSEHTSEESTLTPDNISTNSRTIKTPPVSPIHAAVVASNPRDHRQSSPSLQSPGIRATLRQFDGPTGQQHQAKLKSPPPPTARKPVSRQFTPTHERSSSDSSSNPAQRQLSSTPVVPPKKFKSETPPPQSQSETSDLTEEEKTVSRMDTAPDSTVPTSPKKEALAVLDGTPSVLDRIRALRQQS